MDDNNKIAEFQRRTGVKDDNVSKQILQKNGWDLEKSVVEHRSSKNSIYKTLYFIIKLPFTPIIYLTSGIFSLGKSVLFSFLPSSTTPQRVTPEHTLFIQKFEETYGEMHPAFYQGNFQKAAEKAKNEFQFLLVYIHAATNPKTEDFCKNTLCTQVVSDYVNTNFVFWAGDITQRDAYKTGHILGATSYPFIAIIHCSGDNKIQVLDRFVANVPLDEFIERLGNIQELHSGLLQLDKGRANQTEEDHEVISRQDEAYQQSLLKDMERQRQEEEMRRKLREEKELEELLKKKQQEEIHQQNLMKEKLEQEKKQKEELRKKQLEEKKKQLSEEPPEGNDVCQIMILLLNGERVKRRFLFSDKLSSVFDYVDVCLGEAEYEKYCLVTAFPRKVFERSEKTLKESEFTSKMSLIFEEVYEEDKN